VRGGVGHGRPEYRGETRAGRVPASCSRTRVRGDANDERVNVIGGRHGDRKVQDPNVGNDNGRGC